MIAEAQEKANQLELEKAEAEAKAAEEAYYVKNPICILFYSI